MPTQEPLKAFICHSSADSKFVVEVAKYIERNLDGIYYYEEYQRCDESYVTTMNRALDECNVMIVFIGKKLSSYQRDEFSTAYRLHQRKPRSFFLVLLDGQEDLPSEINIVGAYPQIKVPELTRAAAYEVAKQIVNDYLKRPWHSDDDLPLNPHLFDYEKDVIDYFINKEKIEKKIADLYAEFQCENEKDIHPDAMKRMMELQAENKPIIHKQLQGCPDKWPNVERWDENTIDNYLDPSKIGNYRPDDAMVVAAALSTYHRDNSMIMSGLCFPEAGPREQLAYPREDRSLNVAVIVSGGIAPGINAVIDGITQRHHMYAKNKYAVRVYGFRDGFQAFDDLARSQCILIPEHEGGNENPSLVVTSSHASEGGSILGTSRFDGLLNPETRKQELEKIVSQLFNWRIDILYVIGGDGSMRAAHAIWSFAQEYSTQRNLTKKLSVIAVPKTMDNDILWVWQTFGFLSAVERARELIEHLATEVRSNPRLGIMQLFGSDSGFVVSHAVLASKTGICDAALIPEVNFSMKKLAAYLKRRIGERHSQEQKGRLPYGFVVMAETAIPTDAIDFIKDPDIGLSRVEMDAVLKFDEMRKNLIRIQGQTDDSLRTAGLKIVSRGLQKLLPQHDSDLASPPDWSKLRVFTNEPRHLLRATPPRSIDIITAQRLGILAVDNALAGYTDFMISQWLTEYVLVPLKLVLLGRKRIPKGGIFWKSVIAKTGQPFEMDHTHDKDCGS
jgi:6-phosphofructokinase 1